MGDEGAGMTTLKLRFLKLWKKNQTLTYCDCLVGECHGVDMVRCAFHCKVLSNNNFYKLNDGLWHHLEIRDGSLYYDGMEMIVAFDQGQFDRSPGQHEAASDAARHVIDTVRRRNN